MTSMLFHSLASVIELSLEFLVLLLHLNVLLLEVRNFFILDGSLVLQPLVLYLNVSLNLRNVLLCLLLGVEFEIC